MRVVGFIPAKGSSSRTPSKNIQKILGVPLFLWAANNLNRVLPKEDIYIDSDDDFILDEAKKHGFSVIKRPEELATNATDGNQLMMWQASNVDADVYIQHLPPMIFLKKETIAQAISAIKNGCDSAFAVYKESFYLWGEKEPLYDLKNLPNSFTLPQTIIEGMGFYITTKKALFGSELRISGNFSMIDIDRYEAIDIDYPEDLEFARVVAKGLSRTSGYLVGLEKLSIPNDVRLIIMDVDGVLTDGGMYYSESGDEFKKFNTKDGMAIKEAVKKGFKFGIISSGINENLIKNRASLLGVEHVYVGKARKEDILLEWLNKMDISFEQVAYIGDDINDKVVMKKCGFSACPSDATEEIKHIANVILNNPGGHCCVREFIEKYISGRLS